MPLVCFIIMIIIMAVQLNAQDALGPEYMTFRPPTVAGIFYDANPDSLKAEIKMYLDNKDEREVKDEIIAMISPHAGYKYSGWVAGKGYKELIGKQYDVIIILAPSHHKRFKGASVFNGQAYSSPLGITHVDDKLAIEIALSNKLISLSMNGHEWRDTLNEHSIEVQLPFIQTVLPNTPIVPISIGTQDNYTTHVLAKAIIDAVNKLGRKPLIIASTDLSHFHDQKTARAIDKEYVESFARYDYFKLAAELDRNKLEACGGGAVNIAMIAAEMLGANKALPHFYASSYNSPYARTDANRVVGYMTGFMVKSNEPQPDLPVLDDGLRKDLLWRARFGIESASKGDSTYPVQYIPVALNFNMAAFVTIRENGKLRGCMGHTYPTQVVTAEVEHAARLAAVADPRFSRLDSNAAKNVTIEVTLLSRMRKVYDTSQIIVGVHGVYIRKGNYSGLLLPQVAREHNWDRDELLRQACRKAGIGDDAYTKADTEIFTFTALTIEEK